MTKHIQKIIVMSLTAVLCLAAMYVTAFADTTKVTATIPVSITALGLEGTLESDIPKEEYSFILTAMDDAPLPQDCTLTITGSGLGSFEITYTQVGVYQYIISQDASALTGENSCCHDRGCYDDTIYYVVITVTNADEGLGLDITVSAHKDSITGDKPQCLDFVNTYAPVPYDILTVEKTWTDNSQIRPDSIQVKLLDGETVVDTVTLNADQNWSYTWSCLDPYESHDWSVVEVEIDGYTPEYTTGDGVVSIHNVGDIDESLAQTGQLNWPIVLFCVLGACFMVLGIRLMREKKRSDID